MLGEGESHFREASRYFIDITISRQELGVASRGLCFLVVVLLIFFVDVEVGRRCALIYMWVYGVELLGTSCWWRLMS
jgi:hypothetical protein